MRIQRASRFLRQFVAFFALVPPLAIDFRILRHDPTLTTRPGEGLLLMEIKEAHRGVKINTFIPMKHDTSDILDRKADFLITVTDPSGNLRECAFNQELVAPFEQVYPDSFHPRSHRIQVGIYQLRIYIDGDKDWDTTFTIREDQTVEWEPGDSKEVLYSTFSDNQDFPERKND